MPVAYSKSVARFEGDCTVEEALAAVVVGHVALLPASVAALHPRPGVAYVTATDAGVDASSDFEKA